MKRDRYEVRPDGDRFIIWDNERDAQADELNGWQFTSPSLAETAAFTLNHPETKQ